LKFALQYGDMDMIKFIVNAGANIFDHSGSQICELSVLNVAVLSGKLKAVKFLLKKGVTLDMATIKLAQSCQGGRETQVAMVALLEGGVGCRNCGREAKTLKKCSGCFRAKFCDAKCMKECWSAHKKECKEYQQEDEKKKNAPEVAFSFPKNLSKPLSAYNSKVVEDARRSRANFIERKMILGRDDEACSNCANPPAAGEVASVHALQRRVVLRSCLPEG
jgi:hypothetical protein